jgi:hypothetical protein
VRLWSRNEKDFGPRYAGNVKALANLPNNTVVDGEIAHSTKWGSLHSARCKATVPRT